MIRPPRSSRSTHLVGSPDGYLTATPFKRGPVTVVKIDGTVDHARTRRLDAEGDENEERRLLAHADPHLRAVLTAATHDGMPHRRALVLAVVADSPG